MSNGNGNTAGGTRQSVLSAGLEILRTQGAATVVLLMVIWIGREASLKWLDMQNLQVDSNVALTKQLGESLNQIVECQRESTVFQGEVRGEHRQQTELLLRACGLLETLTQKVSEGNASKQPTNGGN